MFRSLLVLAITFFYQPTRAQVNPRDSSSFRPRWNGRDAVIHRAGDKPYTLYHWDGRSPKGPKEICSFVTYYTGMWVPDGRNRILGTHPLLGMSLGQWVNKLMWDLNFELQLGSAPSSYRVVNNSDTIRSCRFNGMYFGLNLGYNLVNVKKSSIFLTGGVGGSGFTTVQGDDNHDGRSISAFNKNFGLGIHHFGRNGKLVSAMLLYNVINYENPRGTPLDGNAVTLRLMFGGFD
jgi:hypothetical protein